MRILVGTLLLLGATLLQVTLVARFNLLRGSADLVLLVMVAWMMQEGNQPDWRWGIPAGLMVGYASALPDWILWLGYLAAAGACQLLHRRIWQVKLLTLITAVLLGTLGIQVITLIYLWLGSQPLNIGQAFNFVILPSLLLNLILILPINAIISELNKLLPGAETT
jgi:hypothetical protein